MSTTAELACVYSALILVDDDVAVTVSNPKKHVFNPSLYHLLLAIKLNLLNMLERMSDF